MGKNLFWSIINSTLYRRIYKGPQLVPDILQGILKQLNNHKLSNIKEAIGSDLKWIE
jgi:dihydroorotate dehydrogenase